MVCGAVPFVEKKNNSEGVITIPIFDLICETCQEEFEYLQIRSDDFPVCPKCDGSNIKKIFSMMPNIRMDSDSILRSLPDPAPPLTELIGKQRKGTEGGFKELEKEQRQLKEYTKRKDRDGNTVWLPKERTHVDMGKRNE